MVSFSQHTTQRNFPWAAWKSQLALKLGTVQYDADDGQQYIIWFYDGPEVIVCKIWLGTVPEDAGITQQLNDANKADFESNYKPLANRAIEKRIEGKAISSVWPTEGTRKTIISHNWCDKTTWFQGATRVVQETPTTVVSGTVYQLSHGFLIDTFHGKLWDEDSLKNSAGFSYRVLVEVDSGAGWSTKSEVDPHTSVGAYTVDYQAGKITFSPSIPVDASVRVTYHYAGSSSYILKPSAGKALKIISVECQFSTDVEMVDTIVFAPYGYVQVYAPQYCTTNGGPYPPNTLIPLGSTIYKTMYDIQGESNGALPTIPTIGGNGFRGIKHPVVVFQWEYAAVTPLTSSTGLEVRITLQHDIPFNGEFSTATFYCLSENE